MGLVTPCLTFTFARDKLRGRGRDAPHATIILSTRHSVITTPRRDTRARPGPGGGCAGSYISINLNQLDVFGGGMFGGVCSWRVTPTLH